MTLIDRRFPPLWGDLRETLEAIAALWRKLWAISLESVTDR